MDEQGFDIEPLAAIWLKCSGNPDAVTDLSIEEQGVLNTWLSAGAENELLFKHILEGGPLEGIYSMAEQMQPASWQAFIDKTKIRHKSKVLWLSTAAAIIVALLAGWWILTINGVVPDGRQAIKPHAAPTSPDFRRPVLIEGDRAVVNVADTMLDFSGMASNSGSSRSDSEMQQLLVPKGANFYLLLHDSTQVWFNAASSLRFPAVFSDSTREVELTGEAFFKVAHDNKRPFIVHVDDSLGERLDIQVLGTQFNINAYQDRGAIRTALFEGAVQLRKGKKWIKLQVGQQATTALGSADLSIHAISDISDVLSWRKGEFRFIDEAAETVFAEIARWYDLDLVLTTTRPLAPITAHLDRKQPAGYTIGLLSQLGFNVEISGRRLIVSN